MGFTDSTSSTFESGPRTKTCLSASDPSYPGLCTAATFISPDLVRQNDRCTTLHVDFG